MINNLSKMTFIYNEDNCNNQHKCNDCNNECLGDLHDISNYCYHWYNGGCCGCVNCNVPEAIEEAKKYSNYWIG